MANELDGNAPLEDKKKLLALKPLYAGDPEHWAYQLKQDTILVSVDVNDRTPGTRKEVVLCCDILVQKCSYPNIPSTRHCTD
jgi:hypothetical protein